MEHTETEYEAWTQLATRIPKALHRELKLHCVKTETSVMDFVSMAIREKLGRSSGAQAAAPRKPYPRGIR